MIREPHTVSSIAEIKERFPLFLKRKVEACGKRGYWKKRSGRDVLK
jgi:hypothetical protein